VKLTQLLFKMKVFRHLLGANARVYEIMMKRWWVSWRFLAVKS
jgi:hypothetical protein